MPQSSIKNRLLLIPLIIAALALSACSLTLPSPGASLPPPVTMAAPDNVTGINSIAGAIAYDGIKPPYVLYPDGPKVTLTNNSVAKDPTWDELMAFVRADFTDRNAYLVDFYMCGGFAQDLHNNAEAAGIRAGWVAIDFADRSIGHAATTFQTTDRGLVIIDVTSSYDTGGRDLGSSLSNSYDKIAYIKIGQDYGVISLEVAVSPLYNDYLDYLDRLENMEALRLDYEQQVTEYNQAIKSDDYNYSYMTSWDQRLKDLEQELDTLAAQLGGYYWESLGTVSAVTIYW